MKYSDMMPLLTAFVDVLALLNRQNITLLYLSVDIGIVRSTLHRTALSNRSVI